MRTFIMGLLVVMQLSHTAMASESNFNFTAFERASQTGIDHANCRSALSLSPCESSPSSNSSATLHAGPSPMLGGGIGSLIVALVAFILKRKK